MRLKTEDIFYASLFALIVFEGDYVDYEAITEPIFATFFSQTYIPIVSPYEILGMILLAWVSVKNYPSESPFRRQAFWALAIFTGLHFLIATVQMGLGLALGGRLQVAFWQMKSFSLFPIWSLLGFWMIQGPRDATRLLSMIVAAMAVKTLYNCEVLWIGMGGSRGTREYVSSHMGSWFMALSIIIMIMRLIFTHVPRGTAAFYRVFIALTLFIWFANDRRASLMGAVLSIIFAAVVALPFARKKTVWKIARALVIVGLVIGVTWNLPPPTPGGFIRDVITHGGRMDETQVDYRDLENFNLFLGISHHPMGRGYGFPFVRYVDMPDIFSIAEILSWVPHNSLLMIWLFGGPQNVASLGLLFAMSIAVSVRLFRVETDKRIRIYAMVSMMAMIQWLIYVWADMAWSFTNTVSIPAVLVGGAAGLLGGAPRRRMERENLLQDGSLYLGRTA